MKKLFIFSSLVSIFMFSCKTKKENPAPVINTTTIITPNTSSDQFGHMSIDNGIQYTRLNSVTKSTPNFSTSTYYNHPTATFYSTQNGLITLDSVYCSGRNTVLSNTSPFYQSGNITFPLSWKIGGVGGFPSTEVKITTQSDAFALAGSDFNDSISTSIPYTIKLNKKLIDADRITLSLYLQLGVKVPLGSTILPIGPSTIQFSKEVSIGFDSLTLNTTELAKVTSSKWTTGAIKVSCSKDTSVTIDRTTYNFSTERSILLNVYFK